MVANVKISGLDQGRTRPSGKGVLDDIFLTLEPKPTSAWAALFDALWTRHIYMQKRRARVVGDGLIVTTTIGELEGGLLDELKKVVAATNQTALAQAEEEQRQRQALADQEKARRDALAEGAKRLKFD